MFIKICGLTNESDVRLVVEAGADCVGFVLYPKSPRYISPDLLVNLTALLPAHILKVGVVVNPDPDDLRRIADRAGLDLIQYHGDESSAFVQNVGLRSWKAVGLRDVGDIETACDFQAAECLLVDAVSGAERGGTGRICDWELARQLGLRRQIILAGGLSPDNVAQAIQKVHPFGVDVSSGVESSPGRKDHDKVRAFIAAAREA